MTVFRVRKNMLAWSNTSPHPGVSRGRVSRAAVREGARGEEAVRLGRHGPRHAPVGRHRTEETECVSRYPLPSTRDVGSLREDAAWRSADRPEKCRAAQPVRHADAPDSHPPRLSPTPQASGRVTARRSSFSSRSSRCPRAVSTFGRTARRISIWARNASVPATASGSSSPPTCTA